MLLKQSDIDLFLEAKSFGLAEVEPMMQQLPDDCSFVRELYDLGIRGGYCGLNISKDMGGKGYDYLQTALIYEGLAHGDGTFSFMMQLHNNITLLIDRLTQEDYFKAIVKAMAAGEKLTAFALTESGAGSDPGANHGYAVKKEDGYHVFAEKRWIANAEAADYFVTFAKKEEGRGMYMFLADKKTPGIEVRGIHEMAGANIIGPSEIDFCDCVIPERMLITERGYQEALASIDVARIFVPAICVGMAQRAVDCTVEYLKTRVSMGQPVINSQAIQWQLAELEAKIEAARQLVYRTAAGMDAGEKIALLAAKNKLFAPAVAMEAATLCVQLQGAAGMLKHSFPARCFTAAKLFSILDGSSEIQKFIIGRQYTKVDKA